MFNVEFSPYLKMINKSKNIFFDCFTEKGDAVSLICLNPLPEDRGIESFGTGSLESDRVNLFVALTKGVVRTLG